MASKVPAKRYVSLETAAQYLDTTTRTIRRKIAAGEITGYRAGSRMIRVDLNEIDDILQARRMTSDVTFGERQ